MYVCVCFCSGSVLCVCAFGSFLAGSVLLLVFFVCFFRFVLRCCCCCRCLLLFCLFVVLLFVFLFFSFCLFVVAGRAGLVVIFFHVLWGLLFVSFGFCAVLLFLLHGLEDLSGFGGLCVSFRFCCFAFCCVLFVGWLFFLFVWCSFRGCVCCLFLSGFLPSLGFGCVCIHIYIYIYIYVFYFFQFFCLISFLVWWAYFFPSPSVVDLFVCSFPRRGGDI